MRRALLCSPFILACGGLGGAQTADGGSPGDFGLPPPDTSSLSIDKPAVNLGTLDVKVTGLSTVTLTNNGDGASGPVIITASTGVTATGCSGPLASGASCTITITATPTAPGAFSGTVSISANPGAATPLEVAVITSVGTDPLLAVSPGFVDLGPIPVGFPIPPVKLMVYTGSGLTDLTVAAAGPDVSIDLGHTTCTAVLEPGASCDVFVNLNLAATVGQKSEAIVISAGGSAGKIVTISITANVVTGVFLLINPSTDQYFLANAGQTSSPITFTVGNQGDKTSGTLAVAFTGPNRADFAATSTCTELAPLATCTVSVVFRPTTSSAARETAALNVSDISMGAVVSTVDVPLVGDVPPG